MLGQAPDFDRLDVDISDICWRVSRYQPGVNVFPLQLLAVSNYVKMQAYLLACLLAVSCFCAISSSAWSNAALCKLKFSTSLTRINISSLLYNHHKVIRKHFRILQLVFCSKKMSGVTGLLHKFSKHLLMLCSGMWHRVVW
jgi:hypothetical protein